MSRRCCVTSSCRRLWTRSGGGLFSAALPLGLASAIRPLRAAPVVATNAHIVIAGAGAAGLATASRLAQRLSGARITLIDGHKQHFYQPGYTLVAAGLETANYVISRTRDYVPAGVSLIEENVAEFDPERSLVVTSGGQRISYDFLVVATGLHLDYSAIAGMDLALIGTSGIGSVYAGPSHAEATWRMMSRFADEGGVGLCTRPATEMKCAGAPLKCAFITDDHLRRRGNRSKAELIYAAPVGAVFSVPIVAEKVRMLFEQRGIKILYNHVMTAIDPGLKVATFSTPQGVKEINFDFINVIPPMRAPAVVCNSALAWREGPFAADSWVETDKQTLRHKRFPNVFSVGDVAGVPKGKTAASVKWQVPVAVDHLVASLSGQTSPEVYNGYTSCPLITKIGRAMLVEFDYNNNLVPSFPGVIPPLEELWTTWLIEAIGLKPTYMAMLRGLA